MPEINMDRSVTVVVLTRNSESTLSDCLLSILRNGPREVIVVDGESTDNTVDIAKRLGARVLSDNRKGLGFARNMGARNARGDYITFIDSDVLVPPHFLDHMMRYLQDFQYDAVHALVECPQPVNFLMWAEQWLWEKEVNESVGNQTSMLPTMSLLSRTSLFKEVPFDNDFSLGWEDRDWSFRAAKLGYRLGVVPVRVIHLHRSEFSSVVKTGFAYGRGIAIFALKHKQWERLSAPIYRYLVDVGNVIRDEDISLLHKFRLVGYLAFYRISRLAGMLSQLLAIH